jgi:carbon starvation protein
MKDESRLVTLPLALVFPGGDNRDEGGTTMITAVVLATMAVLLVAYRVYGRFISRQLQLDNSRPTPAVVFNDGVDYVPAPASLLMGQHFSAIAAAGPIVGPVLAGIWFGWLPAALWIVIGAIFIGGVHDASSLAASIRHKASSVGELARQYMSPTSHILFLTFMWLTLVYVIVAFTDITGQTFKYVTADTAFGPGVAFSSVVYLLLGVLLGVLLYKFHLNLTVATLIFLPLVFVTVWIGPRAPAPILDFLGAISVKEWDAILLVYCFVASLLPMWLLLQPRGYLGGWFLYVTIGVGLCGALFGGYSIQYPAWNVEGMHSLLNGKPILPILFITVACGACSGFHAIVSSGTTSKQLKCETDARVVGYGAMLLEALVAILALATVMMLAPGDAMLKQDPNLVYASGLANYMGLLGIDFKVALAFALLAFSTFVYDTLDVSTRLARYVLQELFGWKSMAGAVAATFITLLAPFAILMATREKGYLVAWPIFGTSNQLMASLTLLAVSVWLRHTGRRVIYAVIPMVFMMAMTLWSLVLQIMTFVKVVPDWIKGGAVKPDMLVSGVVGIALFVLAVWLILEAVRVLIMKRGKGLPISADAQA